MREPFRPMSYDSLNRLVASTDALDRTTSYGWDAADNRISVTDPTNATTTFIYSTCLLQAVVNPLNQAYQLYIREILHQADPN